MKNHLASLLNFFQIYSLKVTRPSFSRLSMGKLFWTRKNILLWWLKYLLAYCLNICGTIGVSRWIKPLFIFSRFLKKVSIMFCNFLVTMVLLKNSMNLTENTTYMRSSYFEWLQLVDSIPERWKIIIKQNYENATNLIIHDHYSIKGSRVLTLHKLTSTEIYSILISKFHKKLTYNLLIF